MAMVKASNRTPSASAGSSSAGRKRQGRSLALPVLLETLKRKRRRAAAAVEFALVVSLLFMLLIGLINYGWIFLKVQQISQAARAGARAAIVADSTAATVESAINAWMAEADIATFSYVLTPADVAIDAGLPIKVEITVPTDQLALINTSLIPVPSELHAAASMAKEGP